MSVNSGFATRQNEVQYNTLVYNLLYLLQFKVKKGYDTTAAPELNEMNFRHLLLKTYQKAQKMEQTKCVLPKFSLAIKDLICCIEK